MKYLKMLVLAAIAATALTAFAGTGTASAAGVLCSTQTAPCNSKWANGTTTTWSLSEIIIILRETGGETLDSCNKSSVSASLTNGSSTTNASGPISSLTWEECTWTTTTIQNGGLEVVSAGSHNGTVKANSEIRWTISIPFFGSCVYGFTAGTTVGTITEGKPATFDGNAVVSKLSGSSITCPSTAILIFVFRQTAPANTTLSVEPS
jgi:hypothetical protein